MLEQSCAVPPKALRAALSSEKSPCQRQAALAEQFPQCTSSQLKAKHWGKGVIM